MSSNPQNIILFDGVCKLCNHTVQFLIRHDKQQRLYFASLQSPIGRQLLESGGLSSSHNSSIILIANGQYHSRSGAALRILRLLGSPWNLAYTLIIIPPFIRNGLYWIIARYRYRIFGRRDSCLTPSPQLQSRFLS